MPLLPPPSSTYLLDRDRTGKFTGRLSETWVRWIGELFAKVMAQPITRGVGSPEGVVRGEPGDLYINTSGGVNLTLWVKQTGSGTLTGWAAK